MLFVILWDIQIGFSPPTIKTMMLNLKYLYLNVCTYCKCVFLVFQNVEVEEERVDERSVDDLLSFINGEDGGVCGQWFYFILFVVIFGFIFFFYSRIAPDRRMGEQDKKESEKS